MKNMKNLNLPLIRMQKTTYVLLVNIFLCALFLISLGMTVAAARGSISQGVFNVAHGEVPTEHEVQLLKLERNVHGETTTIPIPDAEFHLYRLEAVEGGEEIRTRVSGPHVTDEEGAITLHLLPGDYCFRETKLPPNFTFDVNLDGELIRDYCFSLTGEETEIILVTAYNQRLRGEMRITKTVEGDLEEYDKTQEFEFTVTFSDSGTYDFSIDDGQLTPLTSGGTLTLRDGQTAVFANLPVGITYIVVETPLPNYVITSDNHQGTITVDENSVHFVNTFEDEGEEPIDKTSQIIVTKEVYGENVDETRFEFVTIIEGEEIRFFLSHNEYIILDELPIGVSYEICEMMLVGYLATPECYRGYVLSQTLTLPFINHQYGEPDEGETGALQISKTVVGENINLEQEFIFDLTLGNLPEEIAYLIIEGENVPVTSPTHTFEVILRHGERVLIEGLPQGVYYIVEEIPVEGYVSGIVIQTGTIVAETIVEASFINERLPDPPPEELTSLLIRKEVVGNVPESEVNREYDFVLTINDEEYTRFSLQAGNKIRLTDLPVGATYAVTEMVPDGWALVTVENGMGTLIEQEITVTFTNRYSDPIMIELEGTKTWELLGHEVDLPDYIIIHLKRDGEVVDTVIVFPDKAGNWTYSFNVPKYDEAFNVIEYTIEEEPMDGWEVVVDGMDLFNIYIPPVNIEIPVTKQLTGNILSERNDPHSFFFLLKPQDHAPIPDDGNLIIMINVEETEPVMASFSPIIFIQPGTYIYHISEINTATPGIMYDEAIFVLTLVVENIEGELVITSETLTRKNQPVTEIVFVNNYFDNNDEEPTAPPTPTPKPQTGTGSQQPGPTPPTRPPLTGDSTRLSQWVVLLVASSTVLCVNIWVYKKHK